MSIPIHNLYDFVHLATKKQYILMYHYPFGSRDLHDVCSHQPDMQHMNGPLGIAASNRLISKYLPAQDIDYYYIHKTQPVMFCHDQEPLNFDLYQDHSDYVVTYRKTRDRDSGLPTENLHYKNSNLRWTLYNNIQKSWTLLHSEVNSKNLTRYESTGKFVGAYWWSHAMIARDWYRFAEYDNTLVPNPDPARLFLMYCRDTTGSRQYRKDLLNQLGEKSLLADCQIESFYGVKVDSTASAIYNVSDYNSTAISVVLETLFDERIHLTEKILRPIACGHPFILAAGPGSLRLLRSYGFQTFAGYINENYDDIQDNSDRLSAIANEMKRIQQMPDNDKKSLIAACRSIAQHNRKRFFSKEFFNQVVEELERNVDFAGQRHGGELDLELWWRTTQWYKKNGLNHILTRPYRKVFLPLYRKTRNCA